MTNNPYKQPLYRFEVLRHTLHEPGQIMTRPADISAHFNYLSSYDREHMVRLDLNGAHEAIGYETISIGTDNMTVVSPKEVFRGALLTGANCIALVHNHPSGQTQPSQEDIAIAKQLKQAGDLLSMPVLDFIIVGRNSDFYSLVENSML